MTPLLNFLLTNWKKYVIIKYTKTKGDYPMETITKTYIVRREGEADHEFDTHAAAISYAESNGGVILKVVTTVKTYYELSREGGLWTTIEPNKSV
jgi:hypothetical protein